MSAFGSGDDQAWAVALQSDGKIVAGGYSHNGSNKDFALARYDAHGNLDTTFDADGKVTTAIGSADDAILGIAVQGDGKIVAVGYMAAGSDFDFALARYNADGSLDASFDSDGRVVTDAQDLYIARAVALQADGKIVVGGYASVSQLGIFAIARYNSDGSLDTGFDTDGIVRVTAGTYPPDVCFAVAVQPDGKIVGAGRSNVLSADLEPCIVRLNGDGTLDPSFDADGILLFDFPDNPVADAMYGIGISSAGGIVIGGGVFSNNAGFDFAAARCTESGVIDSAFDTDGMVITELGAGWEEAFGLAVQANDKIVLAGYSNNSVNEDFAVMRYNADGSLDTTFDLDGKLTLIFGTGDEQAHGVALQSDGRIVVAGYAWNGSDYDFAIARIWP